MIKNDEYLLILGANHETIPLYETAAKIGLNTIGIDIDPQAIARDRASRFFVHSLRDVDGILKLVENIKLSGVVSCFDAALSAITRIAKERNLPYTLTPASIEATNDKFAFAEMCRAIGLHVPQTVAVKNLNDLNRFFDLYGAPVILKPGDSAGSKGVTMVSTKDQLPDALQAAQKYSFAGKVVMQKFIQGDPLTVDVFRIQGKTVICSIIRRKHAGYPAYATVEAFLGDIHSVALQQAIRSDCQKICERIQLQNGPLNFDVINTPAGFFWIEMNGRLSGNGLPTLLRLAYGFDAYEMLLRLMTGGDLSGEAYERTLQCNAALKIIGASTSGRLIEVRGVDEMRKEPCFVSCELFARKDDPVEKYVFAKSKVGYLFLAGQDSATLMKALQKASQCIRVVVRPQPENIH